VFVWAGGVPADDRTRGVLSIIRRRDGIAGKPAQVEASRAQGP